MSLRSLTRHLTATGLAVALLGFAGGCFNQNGGVTGYYAYVSTPLSPKTIMIYDIRSGDPFFVQEVPVGKQLNFKFLPDGGDDPLYSPARLQWGIGQAGDQASKLQNQLTCPPEEACRIRVEVRQPEVPDSPDSERFRVELEDEQPYLTPEGGKIPERRNRRVYE